MSEQITKSLALRARTDKLHNFYIIEPSQVDHERQLLSWTNSLMSKVLREQNSPTSLENHSDVLILSVDEDQKNYSAEDIKEVFSFLNFKATHLLQKFIIITDASKLSESHFNKLLKTFEEPPISLSIFLLNPQQTSLLPTIYSRGTKFTVALTPQAHEELDLSGLSFSEFTERYKTDKAALNGLTHHVMEKSLSSNISISKMQEIQANMRLLEEDINYNSSQQSKLFKIYTSLESI